MYECVQLMSELLGAGHLTYISCGSLKPMAWMGVDDDDDLDMIGEEEVELKPIIILILRLRPANTHS